MAIQVTKFQDNAGKEWPTELEADASNVQLANQDEVAAFVKIHFPTKADAKRGNPHAGTAMKGIFLWEAHKAQRPELIA